MWLLESRCLPGEHLIEIKPTGTNTVAISATVDLADGGLYTVIATGDGANQPLALKVLDDSTAAPADGSGKLCVGHLAPFAADLVATQVDICLADGTPIAPLQGVPFDVVSDFLEYCLPVTTTSSSPLPAPTARPWR